MISVEEYQDHIWKSYEANGVMKWVNLETAIRKIYRTEYTDKEKLFLISEAVAAVTGRGRA